VGRTRPRPAWATVRRNARRPIHDPSRRHQDPPRRSSRSGAPDRWSGRAAGGCAGSPPAGPGLPAWRSPGDALGSRRCGGSVAGRPGGAGAAGLPTGRMGDALDRVVVGDDRPLPADAQVLHAKTRQPVPMLHTIIVTPGWASSRRSLGRRPVSPEPTSQTTSATPIPCSAAHADSRAWRQRCGVDHPSTPAGRPPSSGRRQPAAPLPSHAGRRVDRGTQRAARSLGRRRRHSPHRQPDEQRRARLGLRTGTAAAEREQLSYFGFLAELVMAECDDRDKRRAARRTHDAGFPRDRRIEEFDFDV
jgi:hypothetical protein